MPPPWDQALGRIMAGLLLAGLGLRLAFALTSLDNLPVTSDEALVVLQAKQIAGGDRPLLFLAQPYQFPLGAYLMAPVVEHLPRTPLGARLPGLGLGLAGFLGAWLLIARLGPLSRVWPGLVLTALPSTYLLLYQAAYPVPQHEYMLALWLAAAWLAWLAATRPPPASLGLAGLLGLICGLGLSVHMLALSLLAPLALSACLSGGWRQAPARAGALGLGLALGMLPLLLVWRVHPEASGYVTSLRPWTNILSLQQIPVLEHAGAGALGAFTCTFPDFEQMVSLSQWAKPVLAVIFLFLLLAAGLTVLGGLGRRQGGEPGPPPAFMAAFALAPWIGLALFLLNDRANSGQYRYLLALPWCLPLLVVQVYAAARGRVRWLLGGLAVLLAAFNLLTAASLLAVWREPGFAGRHAQVHDLTPVIAHLRQEGVARCFASHWTAYRLTFQTDGAILCAQPFNERFDGWPIPYVDQVSGDPRAAYVLTSPDALDADLFEGDLARAGIASRRARAGVYRIYDRFVDQREAWEQRLGAGRLGVRASHNPDLAARLDDGNPDSRWDSGQGQQAGMWLEIRLDRPLPVAGVILHYRDYPHDRAGGLRVLHRQGEVWIDAEEEFADNLDPFQFRGGLPLFGNCQQTLRFGTVMTEALRLEVTSPRPDRLWTIHELEVILDARRSGQP